MRWRNPLEPLDALQKWVASPEFKSATGWTESVRAEGIGRVWEFHDAQGRMPLRVAGERALDTTRPFSVGHRVVLSPNRTVVESNRIRWEFAPRPEFTFAAELVLPTGDGDPELTYTLTPQRDAFFSVAYPGAPEAPLAKMLVVPQECDARGHKQFDFVMSEADLRLLFDPLPADIQKNVVNRQTFWNADEAASVFARARTAVCHEPHSLIIALANGTPIIHTYSEFHSPKCWMFKDIGLPEWLLEFDCTHAAKMAETLFEIDADYPAALAKVKKAMDFVHQRQADTMRVVKNVLAAN